MTFLSIPGQAPTFTYAGQPSALLAGFGGLPIGFAVAEQTIPARFRGPIPHAHDTFDEAIYVLEGSLLVLTDDGEHEALAGAMLVAPRGERHGFRNPSDTPSKVLGLWSPADLGIAFMTEIGALLSAGGSPEPDAVRAAYERHGSRLLP